MKNDLILFEDYKVRRLYDDETETWYFSVIDIVQILTQQLEFQAARNYWNVLKTSLKKEGSQSLTNCKRLKLEAADGKKHLSEPTNERKHIFLNHALRFFALILAIDKVDCHPTVKEVCYQHFIFSLYDFLHRLFPPILNRISTLKSHLILHAFRFTTGSGNT